MGKYLNQAERNESFHLAITTHHEHNFYDWKIIFLFYSAIHYLKELGDINGINVGSNHTEIEFNVSPKKSAILMHITIDKWEMYKNLYRYSRSARYSGFADEKTFEKFKELDHKYSLIDFKSFKEYIKEQGAPVKCSGS